MSNITDDAPVAGRTSGVGACPDSTCTSTVVDVEGAVVGLTLDDGATPMVVVVAFVVVAAVVVVAWVVVAAVVVVASVVVVAPVVVVASVEVELGLVDVTGGAVVVVVEPAGQWQIFTRLGVGPSHTPGLPQNWWTSSPTRTPTRKCSAATA